MPRIPETEIERIKSQTDLAALVRARGVDLRPHGSKDLAGKCPFHPDDQPSFIVSPEKGLYHCMGCGAAGNAIQFIQKYDGKMVEMIGYMIPLSETRQIKSFVLVPSLFGCCYGQPPAVNHVVLVRMTGGAATKVYDDKIHVRGQFHCGEEKEDGDLISLYHIDADEVAAE